MVIHALLALPSHTKARLIRSLDAEIVSASTSLASLGVALDLRDGLEAVQAGLVELDRQGIAGRIAANWLRALDSATRRTTAPDLVWTGPQVAGLHARDTREVFDELVGAATSSVWLSTFALFDGQKRFDVLSRRMEAQPGLRATILLNIGRRRGDSDTYSNLVRRFAVRFWQNEWPGPSHPAVYFDPRSLDADGPSGVLHAKAIVADRERLFVTSANLTEAAQERNIELGLLVRDSALALSVVSHFEALIENGLLVPLPPP